MDFFNKTGKLAIGSRLRMLTDIITKDATLIYKMFGVDLSPKWFPVLFVLSQNEGRTITLIAKEIGHSHPSVSNIVKEMAANGLIEEKIEVSDKRRNVVMLSEKGKKISDSLMLQCVDVTSAIERLTEQSQNDLWKAIEEWEILLSEKSLLQRVKEEKSARESKEIKIVTYEDCYQPYFRILTENWINAHWQMEASDNKVVEHPQEHIIDKGGHIFIALYKNEPIGVCALCKLNNSVYDYELAKLAVSDNVQGKGIGELLCKTVINKAIELGGKKLFLESNTILKPAIHLYKKLGFKELEIFNTLYERGNIQMELILSKSK